MRRAAVLPVAFLLLATLSASGAGTGGEGAASRWEQVLHIDSALAGPTQPFEAFDTASLNLYDFNGDGQLEIVANNDNNWFYVLDARTGKILFEHRANVPKSWPIRELNPVAIGDLHGDGAPCMVVPHSNARMSAWCYDAARSTATSFNFTKEWDIKVDAALYEAGFAEAHPWMYHPNGTFRSDDFGLGLDGHAYLADADGDGTMEVFVETDGYPGQFAFSHEGNYLWSKSYWDGNGGAKVLDIDKDGAKEAVFVSDGGTIAAYHAESGGIEWAFEASKNGARPGSVPVAPLVADLHGDGRFETVFGARNVNFSEDNPNWINESHAVYYALNDKGQLLWKASYDWMNPLQYNHPAAADVNGDGVLDVLFLDWNTVGHNPGDWEITNRESNLFALDGRDGSLLWRQPISVWWSNKDFVIADADGDGDQDVIAPTARASVDGIGVYDLETGERQGWWASDRSLTRGPVAGDLYGDGKLHLVLPVSKRSSEPNYRSLDVGHRVGAIKVIATNVPYDATFSANFLNSEDQDETPKGDSGVTPTPVTPDTPPTLITTPTPPEGATTPPTTTPGGGAGNDSGSPPSTGNLDPEESRGLDMPGPGLGAVLVAALAALCLLALPRRP